VGDQVGIAVSGTLYYVPYEEFKRIRSLTVGSVEKAALFAALCRINTLYMIARAGSGHIGSSFSSMDIMSWLQLNVLRTPPANDMDSPRDIFFSSKGHDAPGLYNTWIGLGKLDFDLIHQLRRLNGLPGHPDVSTPNVVTNTGSLGMGVSKAKGMIFANRLLKRLGAVYVLTGDGELQEGQFWESLISAANHKLHELTVIIDHNKLQSDTLVSRVSDLGDLEAKLSAFGWHVSRCDGNDIAAFSSTLADIKKVLNKPKVIIADTIKGKGVSFMEHTAIDSDVELYKFHSGAPSDDAYVKAAQELIDAANVRLLAAKTFALKLETVNRPAAPQLEDPQRLIQAYSTALIEQARNNSRIVALDADLILDTGLIPFQKEFPERFVECGIAEQDMVSQAGGMALRGLLPIIHSFACFLSARPNEQIYNNATEHTKIIYVGSLAGLLPAGPGHSHQAVRDIAALSAIPNLTIVEPSSESEVAEVLDWAVNINQYSTYIRLVSVPWPIEYVFKFREKLTIGEGRIVKQGDEIAIFVYGPIMLSQVIELSESIYNKWKIGARVINFPWLNNASKEWVSNIINNVRGIVIVDNHYSAGGLAHTLTDCLLNTKNASKPILKFGLSEMPRSGRNDEILRYHGLDSKSMSTEIFEWWSKITMEPHE
jgi:transketolase